MDQYKVGDNSVLMLREGNRNEMEAKASFGDKLASRFEVVSHRMEQGSKALRLFAGYFEAVKKELSKLAKGLTKALNPIKQQQQQEKGPLDSWHFALNTIVAKSEASCQAIEKCCGLYGTELLEPCKLFLSQYEQSNKIALKECNKVLDVLLQHRNRVKKAKERYAKAARALGESQEENEVRQKQKTLQESREEYLQQVTALNTFINEKETHYRTQLALMQQYEETRIDFLRKHFNQLFSLSDGLVKDCLDFNASF